MHGTPQLRTCLLGCLAALAFVACDQKNAADTDPLPDSIAIPDFVDVFVGGEGYHTYRIPSVIRTEVGTLLAFVEGRVGSHFDKSANDIVLRRSVDQGLTWLPAQVLHDAGEASLNDPTAVQIREGVNAGRVLLMYEQIPCRSTALSTCEPLPDLARVSYLMYSDDEGETWSPPEDVTAVVTLDGTDEAGVGPGIAIQKSFPPSVERIVFPFRGLGKNYSVWSDDGGGTWTVGETVDDSQTVGGGNEVQIAELSDGTLLLNARNTDDTGFRKVSRSEDGGETWSALEDDDELVDSQVMASVLRFSDSVTEDRERLLFANPGSSVTRVNGTVRLSWDGGETWPIARLIPAAEAGYSFVYSYSVLTRLDCRNVGLLFEEGLNTERIVFARFSIDWLTEGADEPVCPGGPM